MRKHQLNENLTYISKKAKMLPLLGIIILISGTIILFYATPQIDISHKRILLTSEVSTSNQWFKITRESNIVKNSDFNDSSGWSVQLMGDSRDVEGHISEGESYYVIKGEEKVNYSIVSGTINNSENSLGWRASVNPRIPVSPRRIASEPLLNMTKDGCWTSHIWNESEGTPLNPYQKVSAQWDKNVTLPDNMNDYLITSASLRLKVNATVRAYPGLGKDPYVPPYPWGGIEVPGDFYNTYFGEGDYLIFYIVLSNLDKNVNYRVAEFKPENLGTDVGQQSYDYLPDTYFSSDNVGDLIFYLDQVLSSDFQNFTISIGVEINCEDNIVSDMDIFEDIYIKSCDFNISYVKKIDRLTEISWNYAGEQINNEGGIIEINEAMLNFNYKVDQIWPTISPNSEFKFLINDQEGNQVVKLSQADLYYKKASIKGFDVKNLIPTNQTIQLSILIFIGDEFGLGNLININVDKVTLDVSYTIYKPAEESFFFQLLLILAITAITLMTTYFIYYYRVLRYPIPVRKVRKYNKSLKSDKNPDIPILGREESFKKNYIQSLGSKAPRVKNQKFTSIRNAKKSIKIGKPKLMKKKGKASNMKTFVFIIFLMILIVPQLMLIFSINFYSNKVTTEVNPSILHLNQESNILIREPHVIQLINKSSFDSQLNWSTTYEGDVTDLNAKIENSEANYIINGDGGTNTWIMQNPIESGWSSIENWDGIPTPQVYEMYNNGWYVRHRYVDNNLNQSVKIQWEKNFTMNVNMSDYQITSASLQAWINGSVQALQADTGGIDRPGDTTGGGLIQIATGDFARFFIIITDQQKERLFEAVTYQTDDLGKDFPTAITTLNDTLIMPLNEEALIFYLNEVLKNDYRNFTLIVGIYIWCEDSVYSTDRDYWNALWMKNVTLSISYEKKINQFDAISWVYNSPKIYTGDYQVEITQAKAYFDYKLNRSWITDLSPNSELTISINSIQFNETIKLVEGLTSYQHAREEGFHVTQLVPPNEPINFSITVFIADNFILTDDLEIAIDNATLWISYNLLVPFEISPTIALLAVIFTIASAGIGGYIIAYQKILKYPKQVRKVRKYSRTLKKDLAPNVMIKTQKELIDNLYASELKKTSRMLSRTPVEESVKNLNIPKTDSSFKL